MKKLLLLCSLILSITTFSQIPSDVPANGLVGYWSFTGNANDISGNNITGTVNGATLTTDRQSNSSSAYSFNGINSWIDFGDNDLLNPHFSDMTVSAWIKTTSSYSRIYAKGSHGGPQPGYTIMIYPGAGGRAALVFGAAGHEHIILSNLPVNDNSWHMVTGVIIRNGIIKLFIDGVQQTQTANISDHSSVDIAANTYNAGVGASYSNYSNPGPPTEFFSGTIDEVGVWNRALSDCEVLNLLHGSIPESTISVSACGTYTAPDGAIYTTSGIKTAIVSNYYGCDSTITINLTINQIPSVTAMGTSNYNGAQISCVNSTDGIITASASGGGGGFTYTIDNGINYQSGASFSALGAGSYTIGVKDTNTCQSSASATITAPSAIAFQSTSTVNPVCPGTNGSLTFGAAGGTGGTFAYISNFNGNTVTVINTVTNQPVSTISVGSNPWGVSVTPNGDFVYVTNGGSNSVSVINTSTNSIVATIPVGYTPRAIRFTPDGTKAFVVNSDANSVSVINTLSNTVVATIPVGSGAVNCMVSPTGNQLFVSNASSNTISIINISTNTVTNTLSGFNFPEGIAINSDNSKYYVCNYDPTAGVQVRDVFTNNIIATLAIPYPFNIILNPSGTLAYIATHTSSVYVVNTLTNSIVATIPVGINPYGIIYDQNSDKIYVVNSISNSVTVINALTNTVSSTLTGFNTPTSWGNFIGNIPGGAGTIAYTVNSNTAVSPYNAPAGSYTVVATDANGCATSTSLILTATDTTAPVITAPADILVCNGSSITLGTPVTSDNCSSSIIVTNDAPSSYPLGTTVVTWTADDGYGNTATAAQNITVMPLPVGSASNIVICNGDPSNLSLNSNIVGTTFTWTSSVIVGGVIGNNDCTSGCGNTIADVLTNTGNVHGVVEYTVIPTAPGGCVGSPFTVDVTVGAAPATPALIAGPTGICGLTSAVYSVTPVPEATNYVWTITTGGNVMTIVSGQGTPSINVHIASSNLNLFVVTVTATNACGSSGTSALNITKKPAVPDMISGPTSTCGQLTAAYSIAPVFSATSYIWTLPAGMTVASGTGTTSITVNIATTFVQGIVKVSAVNACGNVPGIGITVTGNVPKVPVSLSGPANVCGLTSATYSVPAVAGATGYNWTITGTGNSISGSNTGTTVTALLAGPGAISCAATNLCGAGPSRVLNLVTSGIQPGIITGPINTCGLTTASYSVAPVVNAATYNWALAYGMTWGTGQGTNAITVNIAPGLTNNTAVSTLKVNVTNVCGNASLFRTTSITRCLSPDAMNAEEVNTFSNIYPNPTSAEFTMDVTLDKDQEIVLEMFDILGNVVISEKHNLASGTSIMKTNMEAFNNGMYFVRILDANSNVMHTERVVKQ